MREAIYKGATRPAVTMGVPLVPFVVATAAAAMLGMYALILVGPTAASPVVVTYLPLMVWMRQVTKRDDQRLRQILLRMRLGTVVGTKVWGGARSFALVELRRGRAPEA
jgi:type IV secretory pathway VirB3-like protein